MKRNGMPVYDILARVWDIVVLNLLFLLCSLPVLTIGAALTALHRVLLQIVRDDDTYLVREFFATFRREFKQSTLMWLPLLIIGAVLIVDMSVFLPGFEGSIRTALFLALLFFEVFWLILMIYVWPLQARYVNPVRQTLKNALLMGIWKFPQTILCAIIYLALPLVYQLFPSMQPVVLFLYLLCGFSLPGLLADSVLNRVFLQLFEEEREKQSDR